MNQVAQRRGAAMSAQDQVLASLAATDRLIQHLTTPPWTSDQFRASFALPEEPRDRACSRDERKRINAALAECPRLDVVAEYCREVKTEIGKRPSLDATRDAIGLMISGFRSPVPHDPDGYQASLVHEASAYPPMVVAMACRRLVKTSQWMPSAAELIGACDAAGDELRRCLDRAQFLRKRLTAAQATISALAKEP